MEVTPVDGAQYFGVKPGAKKSELNMDQFLRLLTVQLEHQNPLEPMGDRDFFAQMAQLGQVQGLEQVRKSLDISQAASLMDKKVTAVRPMTDGESGSNDLISGTVKKLSIRNGEYYLGVQQANGGIVEVKMSAIQSIQSN
jgi:flagellar basal-body rod modification protein FlgD